jgi:chromosome partitioning protein
MGVVHVVRLRRRGHDDDSDGEDGHPEDADDQWVEVDVVSVATDVDDGDGPLQTPTPPPIPDPAPAPDLFDQEVEAAVPADDVPSPAGGSAGSDAVPSEGAVPVDDVGDRAPVPPSPARSRTRGPSQKRRAEAIAAATGDLTAASDEVPTAAGNGSRPVRELPRVLAVANQKGGVGKTTTTVNLGAALAELGYRVLVIDLDPQANATTGLGIDARNFSQSMYDVIMRDAPLEDCVEPTSVRNLFVAPATIDLAGVEIELVPAFSRELKLKKAIDRIVDDFDYIFIDCPPSLGLITVNGLAAASEVLVPIQCEYYALEGLGQLLRNVHLVASNLNTALEISTIVLTMYDSRTRLAADVAAEVREHFADQVCRIVIPRTVRLSEAPSFGQPITVFDPTSRGAVAYRELAKEVSHGAPKRAG